MDKCSPALARNVDLLANQVDRKNARERQALKADCTLQPLVADLVAARAAAAMTHRDPGKDEAIAHPVRLGARNRRSPLGRSATFDDQTPSRSDLKVAVRP